MDSIIIPEVLKNYKINITNNLDSFIVLNNSIILYEKLKESRIFPSAVAINNDLGLLSYSTYQKENKIIEERNGEISRVIVHNDGNIYVNDEVVCQNCELVEALPNRIIYKFRGSFYDSSSRDIKGFKCINSSLFHVHVEVNQNIEIFSPFYAYKFKINDNIIGIEQIINGLIIKGMKYDYFFDGNILRELPKNNEKRLLVVGEEVISWISSNGLISKYNLKNGEISYIGICSSKPNIIGYLNTEFMAMVCNGLLKIKRGNTWSNSQFYSLSNSISIGKYLMVELSDEIFIIDYFNNIKTSLNRAKIAIAMDSKLIYMDEGIFIINLDQEVEVKTLIKDVNLKGNTVEVQFNNSFSYKSINILTELPSIIEIKQDRASIVFNETGKTRITFSFDLGFRVINEDISIEIPEPYVNVTNEKAECIQDGYIKNTKFRCMLAFKLRLDDNYRITKIQASVIDQLGIITPYSELIEGDSIFIYSDREFHPPLELTMDLTFNNSIKKQISLIIKDLIKYRRPNITKKMIHHDNKTELIVNCSECSSLMVKLECQKNSLVERGKEIKINIYDCLLPSRLHCFWEKGNFYGTSMETIQTLKPSYFLFAELGNTIMGWGRGRKFSIRERGEDYLIITEKLGGFSIEYRVNLIKINSISLTLLKKREGVLICYNNSFSSSMATSLNSEFCYPIKDYLFEDIDLLYVEKGISLILRLDKVEMVRGLLRLAFNEISKLRWLLNESS
jgi:hypothetical protein